MSRSLNVRVRPGSRWGAAPMGRTVGALIAVVVLTTGCGQLLFRQDHRITVLTPQNYSTISEPVVVSWATKDFTAGQDGTYLVFVDRSPMAAGETIDVVDKRDRDGIFPTDRTQIKFDVVNAVESN